MVARYIGCFILLLAALSPAQNDAGGLIRQLLRERDDADLELVEKIAKARTREAAEGLIEAYSKVTTLLFRREIVSALAWFANLPDSQQPALEQLAEIAASSQEAELRALALKGLGESPTLGKQLLRKLVESEQVPDIVREPAMRYHEKLATEDDVDWYRFLWNLQQKQRKNSKGEIQAPELNAIRELAFEGLLPYLSEAELVETLKREIDPKIRRMALGWMQSKSMPKAADMAGWLLERVDFPGVDRAEAARIYFEANRDKAVAKFVKLAKKRDVTQADLRRAMADLIAGYDDASTKKRVGKLIGRGKPHEKVFALRASANNDDPKVLAAVRKCLRDNAPEVRRAAAEILGQRRDRESTADLRRMLEQQDNPTDVRIALEALNLIEGPMSAWLRELAGYTAHADRDVRNAAIIVLGKARDKRQLEPLMKALQHDDWSTRYAAIGAVAAIRNAKAVPMLIERMSEETGRMRKHLADALWRLTAQPFDEDVKRWQAWWQQAKADFKVASEKELDQAAAERERRRLTQRTASPVKFFGIKVESHRVVFVLDVSGSMLESMYGREIDDRGAARIDVAKLELSQAIENLEPGALFNIFAFSNGIARWQKEGIGVNTGQSRQDALTWIERLGASGGTNLYDSIKMAFEDADVDTVFVLSDGEPTVGEVIDPHRIREDVAFWNEHRKIKINAIAIGGNLEVLEWIALDSGGTYKQMR